MKIPVLPIAILLTAGLAVGFAADPSPWLQVTTNETTQAPSYPIPDNLVLDLRLFESRALSPNYTAMSELSFFIMTDGRDVSAMQWPGTLAKQVPDAFLAALIADTVPVERGVARFEWTKASRSIHTEVRVENYHPAGTFKAQLHTRFMRGSDTTREHQRELELQMHRTSVWSSDELEIAPTDYLSHFREYADRESRGLLYELLRLNTFFLILAATPRLLTEEEVQLGAPQTLSLPPGVEAPSLENPTGIPLKGTILLGFELDESGSLVNPQIVRSTFPEANLPSIDSESPLARGREGDGGERLDHEVVDIVADNRSWKREVRGVVSSAARIVVIDEIHVLAEHGLRIERPADLAHMPFHAFDRQFELSRIRSLRLQSSAQLVHPLS